MSAKYETRQRSYETFEVRAADNGDGKLRLSGTIVPYDHECEIAPGHWESVAPGAISPDALRDVTLCWQHDYSEPLARTGSGLHVYSDAEGLKFDAELANTQRARDAVELVKRGIIGGVSIGMQVQRDGYTRSSVEGGIRDRIHRIRRVIEASLVTSPAYDRTPVMARSQAQADEAVARARKIIAEKKRQRVTTRAVDPYGAGSPHSWVRDLVLAKRLQQEREQIGTRLPEEQRELGFLPQTWQEELETGDFQTRLKATQELQTRAGLVAGTATAGLELMAPIHLASAFATSVRSHAVVTNLFDHYAYPEGVGETLKAAAFSVTSQASATVMSSEPAGPSTASPVTREIDALAATVAVDVDVSYELFELSAAPSIDVALTQELGRAIAQRVDNQLLLGSGTSGQTLGLANAPSIVTITATSASPTAALMIPPIAQAYSQTSTTLGAPVDSIVMHPRRWAFLTAGEDSNNLPFTPPQTGEVGDAPTDLHVGVVPPGMKVYVSTEVPTTQGAGTNQDVMYVFKSNDHQLYSSPVRFVVADQTLTSTAVYKVTAYVYIASFVNRFPGSVATISGTMLTAPANY